MANVTIVEEDEALLPIINHFRMGGTLTTKVLESDDFQMDGNAVKSLDGLSPNFKRKIANTSVQKFFRGQGNARSRQLTLGDVTAYNILDVVSPPYNLDYLAKLYEISSAHKSAVDAKVANIVGLGWKFVQTNKTKRKLEDITEKNKLKRARKALQIAQENLIDYIDGLNEEDTFTEVMIKVWRDYETMGNGYIEIGRKKDGSVGYIGHVPASTIRVRKERDGFVQVVSNKSVFFRNFGDRSTSNPVGSDTKPNELIHLKKHSPTNHYYGVPDIVAAATAVAGNEFASRFNLDYFENKALPRYVITLKGATLATSTENALVSFFETGLRGQNHRTLYIPLPADTPEKKVEMNFQPIEAKVQDASFSNYKKQNKDEILMAHRVPATKVGLAEGTNLAVARDADKTFKEQVCAPEQRVLEKKLNKIIKELTDAFSLKLEEMSLTDENTQSQIEERRRKTGTETANEQRARRGEPGHPDGDELYDMNGSSKASALSAEVRAQGNRQRDADRSANRTDSEGEGRNPKGDGRTVQ